VPRLLINNELAGVRGGIEDDPQFQAFLQAINDPKGDPAMRPVLMHMLAQMVSIIHRRILSLCCLLSADAMTLNDDK
jgi:hypothetical protein